MERMHIISILLPVLLLVTLGYVLLRIHFLDEVFFRNCAKLTYWIGLPALLLYKIANASVDFSASWNISLVMIFATAAAAAVSAVIGRFASKDQSRRKTFIHTSFHSNTSFVGLPVILYALGSNAQYPDLVDAASIAVAPMIPFVHILSIMVMGNDGTGKYGIRIGQVLKKAFLNPMVLACLLGLLLAVADITIPSPINRGLDSLGKLALPLALLSIGAGLSFSDIRNSLPLAVSAALFNTFLLPFFGFLFSRLTSLPDHFTLISLIFLACPTASSAYIYAREMNGDHKFAGNVIVLSTILSTASLWLVLYFYL
jgi:malate permease and related proteins